MGKLYQFQTAFTVSFGSLVMGLLNVWPSYTLGHFTAENNKILIAPMTEGESSLVGSLPALGAMVGTVIAGPILNKYGRKHGGIICVLPYLVCWLIKQFSNSTLPILVARFMGGVGGGTNLIHSPLFISEVSEPSIRGMLASSPVLLYCVGALLSYLAGWFLNYHTIIWLNLTACVINIGLLFLVRESPLYLLTQNREEEAKAALAHYRDASVNSKEFLEEFSQLKQKVMPAIKLVSVTESDQIDKLEQEKLNPSEIVEEEQPKESAWRSLFKSAASRRAFFVVAMVQTNQVLMGMVSVQVYAKVLFSQAAPDLSANFCSVMFAIVLLVGSLISGGIADKAGRRILLMSSSIVVASCLFTIGVLLQTGIAPPIVTAVIVLLYCFAFYFGAGTVPYILIAEAFAPEVQSLASMLIIEWVWFLNFFVIGVFPTVSKLLGIHGVFYIYGCVAIFNTAFSYFMVPETNGLSNDQIQDAFRCRKRT